MLQFTSVIDTFPTAVIPNVGRGLPVEVSLIAQLGHGAGSQLFSSIAARQKMHAEFVDALEEPSAKIAATNFELGDPTALYSFIVGPQGHPFHRHAGHRIFTAVSGSGGAQLRFSHASDEDLRSDPRRFIDELHFVNIPPDCMFCVRFGGDTWHQFWPLSKNSLHPVFVALSCHTNELGGNLSDELRASVSANAADIPTLTEVLPANVAKLINAKDFQQEIIPTTTLSLDAPAGTIHRKVCDTFRGSVGIVRGALTNWRRSGGYVSRTGVLSAVAELNQIPAHSLLRQQGSFNEAHHNDSFAMTLSAKRLTAMPASRLLELVLEGFLNDAPRGVSRLMMIRNLLVAPLGLRTSPLGCPVSSLLSENRQNLFAGQYPVLGQSVDDAKGVAQVLLGANDKHLTFRSCVGIEKVEGGDVRLTLGTSVLCKNLFGRFYMAAISQVHRRYISPTMLRRAADYARLKVLS
jgi:uncharacterized protein DUF2867